LKIQGIGEGLSSKPAPGLYITATPIGNAADITLRALRVLEVADVIVCEDTRVSGRLLARYGIHRPMLPYHEHNAARARPGILRHLDRGEVVALVSDAGTPLISDPGYKLVRAALEAGSTVTALPGPSAPLAALTVAGLPTDRFFFAGFLPPRAAAQRRALEGLAAIEATLVVLESPRRLAKTLGHMAEILGPREAAVARELTKLHEEVRRAPLPELARHYAEAGAPKGEVVVVVAPPAPAPALDDAEIEALLGEALERASVREAAAEVAAASGHPRREIYARALELKKRR
jgi:16S rRNA (cytidine1402-2'-O)-methyltransferase